MKRRAVLLLAVSVAALGLGCSKKPAADVPPPQELTLDQVEARIAANDGKTFIFDNNDKERWQKGHVPTAKWVEFDKVTAGDLPADKDANLVFYCSNEL